MSSEPHWLWRLDRAGWTAAAATELDAAAQNVARRRTAITHCRRASGMAFNAVLVAWAEREPALRDELTVRWGRSYLEHLQRVAAGDHGPIAATVVELARAVLATPIAAPPLVSLGARAHADVHTLVDTTRQLLNACAAV